MKHLPIFLLSALFLFQAGTARAVMPGEVLKDPVLEHRAREISKGLRCLVCQNQSIDDSDAPLAKDLRVIVRERLTSGDSDDQVISFVVSRYGDFVLLKPPFKGATLVLWGGPILFVLLGILGMVFHYRRGQLRAATAPATAKRKPLSPEEQERLAALLAAPTINGDEADGGAIGPKKGGKKNA